MDDPRLGLVLRALRRRRGWRQVDLARAARVSQSVVSRAERGHLGSLPSVRRLAAAVDARLELDIRWRGGEVDRLADEGHARLGSIVAVELVRLGWRVSPEVTFMRFGERGSIDLLAVMADRRAGTVVELKTELASYEEMQRRLDVETRVADSVISERFGWRPRHLGIVLVLADTSTNRDRARRVGPLLNASLPSRNAAIRRWLKLPEGSLRGVWFVRDMRARTEKCGPRGSHRVRCPRSSSS